MNDKFIQLTGPFTANEELFNKINNGQLFSHLSKLGICADPKHIICINGYDCEIGKTGILQYDNVVITSLYFKQNEPARTKIDCVVD